MSGSQLDLEPVPLRHVEADPPAVSPGEGDAALARPFWIHPQVANLGVEGSPAADAGVRDHRLNSASPEGVNLAGDLANCLWDCHAIARL